MKKRSPAVLFQGDSITECARCSDPVQDPDGVASLGYGYAFIASTSLLADQPGCGWTFLNRGVGGNRVTDLLARWHRDALALKPDVISILIGVNDSQDRGDADHGIFEKIYRLLLEMTRVALPSTRLVLCQPFARETEHFSKLRLAILEDYSRIVRKLALETDAIFVPFQELFDRMVLEAPGEFWLPDGVHPSAPAHFRMAEFWLQHCKVLS